MTARSSSVTLTLAFLPGAKIGVVAPNGMGKSTLLKLMAALEQPSNGEVLRMPGYSVGLLAQEPLLDEAKTVLGNVEEAVAGIRVLWTTSTRSPRSWPGLFR